MRSSTDVTKFGDLATLVLSNTHIKTEVIVKDLTKQMLVNSIRDNSKLDLAIESVFNELMISVTDKEGDYYLQFAKTINGFEHEDSGTMSADPSWLIAMASMPWLDDRMVGITTTIHPINMGPSHSSVQMLAIVLAPVKEKHLKCDVESSKNLASILSQTEFRQRVHGKDITEEQFRNIFKETTLNLMTIHKKTADELNADKKHELEHEGLDGKIGCGRGIYKDVRRRLKYYWSDYSDGEN